MKIIRAFESRYDAIASLKESQDLEPLIPDKAVIVKVRDKSMCIYYHGTGLDYWVDGVGQQEMAEEIGNDIKETDGVFIWSGHIGASTDYWGEHDEWLEGTARPVTDEEWIDLITDNDPWDHEELRAHREWSTRVHEIASKLEKEKQISDLIQEIQQRMGLDKVQP